MPGHRSFSSYGTLLSCSLVASVAMCCSAAADDHDGQVPSLRSPAGSGRVADDRPAGQVTFPSGRVFYVDLAVTLEEQVRGYMWRKEIGPEEGLLFIYKEPAVRKFWMKNCLTAMDMIWLDRQDRVIAIEHSAPPCLEDPCPNFGPDLPSFSILEVAPGVAREEGLESGSQLAIVTDHPRH